MKASKFTEAQIAFVLMQAERDIQRLMDLYLSDR
ncbi:hypothetical protein DmAi_28260 [Acetobacter persici]|uniref:Uncharacterized protein n=1 Tax=Acetobacter persici TaxID=1076596 RepID=A0A6V8ICF6_9PROT|nr:hypothetical protein DmAi_28260 [Acetobacter persici]